MRTENRDKFIFFHLFFYFVAPAGFEPAISPPKGDVFPLHHGALDSFVPVVLAAHVIAASEPMPVFRAFRLFAYSRRYLSHWRNNYGRSTAV